MNYKYKEYKINSHIELLAELNTDISNNIKKAEKLIDYKSTKAYRNKILKEQQNLRNKGEKVVNLIDEEQYNKYTDQIPDIIEYTTVDVPEENIVKTMNIKQKWIYLLFREDTR